MIHQASTLFESPLLISVAAPTVLTWKDRTILVYHVSCWSFLKGSRVSQSDSNAGPQWLLYMGPPWTVVELLSPNGTSVLASKYQSQQRKSEANKGGGYVPRPVIRLTITPLGLIASPSSTGVGIRISSIQQSRLLE